VSVMVIIAGDFNVNLDTGYAVTALIRQFAFEYLLVRCDDIFPQQKTPTYANEALNHKSQIDYFLTSSSINQSINRWSEHGTSGRQPFIGNALRHT